jgi:hypothetical protein
MRISTTNYVDFRTLIKGPIPKMIHAAPVTPSDTQLLPNGSDYLSFVNSGSQTLKITTLGGEVVSIALPSGMYAIRATQVWATGTTVTSVFTYWT